MNKQKEIEKVVDEFEKISLIISPEYSQELVKQQKLFIVDMLSSGKMSLEDLKQTLKANTENYQKNKIHYMAKKIESLSKNPSKILTLAIVDEIKCNLNDTLKSTPKQFSDIRKSVRNASETYGKAYVYYKQQLASQ